MTPRGETGAIKLTDLPRHVRDRLNLFGLNLSTDLLVGADHARLDEVREAADKASCPCLVLIESAPQPFADAADDKGEAAVERMVRVVHAADRLGCNAAAVFVSGEDTQDGFDFAVERLKRVVHGAERLGVNVIIGSAPGLTSSPDKLTELIKKIGGFRIGTFPDFQTAAAAPDPVQFLRRLTPYASALTASSVSFKPAKKGAGVVHEPYDLVAFAKTVASVGYQGTLAIDYRGDGDPEVGIGHTREILEGALGKEVEPE